MAALSASSSAATHRRRRFHYARSDREPGNWVVPFDERMTSTFSSPRAGTPRPAEPAAAHRVLGDEAASSAHESLEGLVVDVEITSWPTPTAPHRRLIEVLATQTTSAGRRNDDPQAPVAARLSR